MRFEIIDYKERYFMREKSRADFIIEILDGNIALADPTLISSDSKRPELPGCLVTALAALLFPPCVLKLCLLEFDELVLRLLFCCFCHEGSCLNLFLIAEWANVISEIGRMN